MTLDYFRHIPPILISRQLSRYLRHDALRLSFHFFEIRCRHSSIRLAIFRRDFQLHYFAFDVLFMAAASAQRAAIFFFFFFFFRRARRRAPASWRGAAGCRAPLMIFFAGFSSTFLLMFSPHCFIDCISQNTAPMFAMLYYAPRQLPDFTQKEAMRDAAAPWRV